MRNDKRLLPLVLVVLTVFVGLFIYFSGADENNELDGNPIRDPNLLADSSDKNVIVDRTAGSKFVEKPLSEVEKSNRLPDTKLDYSSKVRCGTSVITLVLTDAKGAKLAPKTIQDASLFRKLGPYWSRESTVVDHEKSEVICAGYSGLGIEPGKYQIDLRCGGYGSIRKNFEVGADQRRRIAIEFPRWRRVIRLRYADENDSPIPFLAYQPRYQAPKSVSLPRITRRTPTRVLAPRPAFGESEELSEEFGLGGGAGGAFNSRSRYQRFLTDKGSWYIAVFAGAESTLKQHFQKRHDGREYLDITSDFTGSEWDDYVVKLKYSKRRKEKNGKSTPENPDNPGNVTTLADPNTVREDARDIPWKSPHIHRVIFDPAADIQVKPVILDEKDKSSRYSRGKSRSDRRPTFANGSWYADIFHRNRTTLTYCYSDRALLRSPVIETSLREEVLKQQITVLSETIPSNRCIVELALSSATSRAWARNVRVAWGKNASSIWDVRRTPVKGGEFALKSAISTEVTADGKLPHELIIQFECNRICHDSKRRIELDEEQTKNLMEGRLRIEPELDGVIVRAVDSKGAGLPWVVGSIIELDRLSAANRLRERMVQWRKDEKKDRNYSNKEFKVLKLHGSMDPEKMLEFDNGIEFIDKLGDKAIRALLGDGLYDELESDLERKQYAENFVWYSTYNKLRGDDRGYLARWRKPLISGTRYVLFLWSSSRDHLKPDHHIIFTAQEKLTDLGAVVMPDYKE